MRGEAAGIGRRDGVALPTVVLLAMVLAVLLASALALVADEDRVSRSTALAADALTQAERGLDEVVGGRRGSFYAALAGDTVLPPDTAPGAGRKLGVAQVRVRRLDGDLFLLTSRGVVLSPAGDTLARREIGQLMRAPELRLPASAAMTTLSSLTVSGNAEIRGDDASSPGCQAGPAMPGVVVRNQGAVTESGGKQRIWGDPPVVVREDLTSATLLDLGGLGYDELAALADRVYADDALVRNMAPAYTPDGACDTSVGTNWGDPAGTGACRDWLPIIHVTGDFHVTTGQGQGILLVDGELKLTGNASFYGLVIVKGSMSTQGTGNRLEGVTYVLGSGLIDSSSLTTGDAVVRYSSCRVDAAAAALRPLPLQSRGWFDLTSAAGA